MTESQGPIELVIVNALPHMGFGVARQHRSGGEARKSRANLVCSRTAPSEGNDIDWASAPAPWRLVDVPPGTMTGVTQVMPSKPGVALRGPGFLFPEHRFKRRTSSAYPRAGRRRGPTGAGLMAGRTACRLDPALPGAASRFSKGSLSGLSGLATSITLASRQGIRQSRLLRIQSLYLSPQLRHVLARL